MLKSEVFRLKVPKLDGDFFTKETIYNKKEFLDKKIEISFGNKILKKGNKVIAIKQEELNKITITSLYEKIVKVTKRSNVIYLLYIKNNHSIDYIVINGRISKNISNNDIFFIRIPQKVDQKEFNRQEKKVLDIIKLYKQENKSINVITEEDLKEEFMSSNFYKIYKNEIEFLSKKQIDSILLSLKYVPSNIALIKKIVISSAIFLLPLLFINITFDTLVDKKRDDYHIKINNLNNKYKKLKTEEKKIKNDPYYKNREYYKKISIQKVYGVEMEEQHDKNNR